MPDSLRRSPNVQAQRSPQPGAKRARGARVEARDNPRYDRLHQSARSKIFDRDRFGDCKVGSERLRPRGVVGLASDYPLLERISTDVRDAGKLKECHALLSPLCRQVGELFAELADELFGQRTSAARVDAACDRKDRYIAAPVQGSYFRPVKAFNHTRRAFTVLFVGRRQQEDQIREVMRTYAAQFGHASARVNEDYFAFLAQILDEVLEVCSATPLCKKF